MKREGRQHGMVRTCRVLPDPLNPRPQTRHVNQIDSPPTAGLFTKVPTNHSKFTGKCGKPRCNECHIHPASTAKDKTKGNQKFKSSDVAWNRRLVTWRVVHGQPGLNSFGFSATEILDCMIMSSDYDSNDGDGHDEEEDEINGCDGRVDDRTVDNEGDGNNYEEMGFFNVDHVIDNQIEEDEGWCLVLQIQT